MAEKAESINIDYYLGLISKRRWFILIPFCIAMAAGIWAAFILPRTYEASTLILVMPQRVPQDYVQSIVSTDIESRISTMSQQILSRSNLEKIIGKFGLFSDPKYSGMFVEDMVEGLRERINVEINRTRRRQEADAFTITFEGGHPKTVMDVTNALAGSFIEENLKTREAQAVGTSDFLADEAENMRRRLEGVEKKLREYRRQYMGELPEQLDANLQVLERLQMQLTEREKSLRQEKSRLIMVESQIAANRKILTESRPAVSEDGEALSLEQLRAQLATLKSTYTDRHPDVIKLKARIADMEAGYKSGTLKSSGQTQINNSGDPAVRMVSNSLVEAQRQRIEIRGEIKNIEGDIANLKRQLRHYQERVERTPQREQELLSFNRDYDNIKESYNSVLNRKLESEIAVNMEKKQKGEQFRIVDRATLPQRPVSPDMKKLLLLSIAGGLGLGAGLIFVLEYFNTSLKGTKEYESELGLAVLATIPWLYDQKDRLWMKANLGLTLFSIIIALVLTAGFAALVFNGVEPTVELVRQYVRV